MNIAVAARASDVPTLEIADVDLTYATGARGVEALRGISLSIAEGEFVSIVGPSGCGKSSLLKLILGLQRTTRGTIALAGTMIDGPSLGVGAVFQSPVLLPWRSVLQNVMFPVELQKLPRERYRRRALELLRMTKLDEFAVLLPRQLSGGMRQRAAICRALVHDPRILLMDEPFSALDAITRDEMAIELLSIWQAHRKTVIFVTHSIREACLLSDRVLVMGRRPSTIVDETAIALPRPRTIAMTEDEDFNHYVRHLRQAIEASHAG